MIATFWNLQCCSFFRASVKSENVEVKDEQSNDKNVTEQSITSVDESSNAEMKDTDKNTNNKEV